MRIISILNVKPSDYYCDTCIRHELFSRQEDTDLLYEASGGSVSVLKEWFDKIGIRYEGIDCTDKKVTYTVLGVELSLSDLGFGERSLLYLLVCKAMNKKVIMDALFERLGGRMEQFIYDEFKEDDFLTVIQYNVIVPRAYKYLIVNEI